MATSLSVSAGLLIAVNSLLMLFSNLEQSFWLPETRLAKGTVLHYVLEFNCCVGVKTPKVVAHIFAVDVEPLLCLNQLLEKWFCGKR